MESKPVYQRSFKMNLPNGQSAFLWGARKTGKSTYLKNHFPGSVVYDLLQSDVFNRLLKAPHEFREEVLLLNKSQLKYPIIIDEIQKVPQLLDEVHWLIENSGAYFILCGSSARKLKHASVNMLGGRAWRYAFYPLTFLEIPGFDLLRALNHGLIPSHYISEQANRHLKAYVQNYLAQEIQAEGLVRNLPAFARFLDSLAFSHGELTNFSNIARDCTIDSKTAKEYYQILVDTLIGYFIYPYTKKNTRDIITAMPKFYLFDTGLANHLAKRKLLALKGSEAGHSFEHFILMELLAYRDYHERDFDIRFWRTKSGLEVDFVLDDAEIAVEVKLTDSVKQQHLKGLAAFYQEHAPKKSYLVCDIPRGRKIQVNDGFSIDALPWKIFLKQLWAGEML